MKSIDEQMVEIRRRSEVLKERKKISISIIGYACSVAACCALIIVSAFLISGKGTETTVSSMSKYGSLIITAPYMGYVIIGLLAFTLGILVTLLCKKIVEINKCENRRKPDGL